MEPIERLRAEIGGVLASRGFQPLAPVEKRWRGEVLRDLDFALAWLDRADIDGSRVRSPASDPPAS